MNTLYRRTIAPRIDEALQDTPVVLILGPRQAGKTTLVKQLASEREFEYITLDDHATLLSAQHDPVSLVQRMDRAIIDEVQRAPHLILAIKKSVDEDRRPGRFILTGSANLMTLPQVADSLAGRMETLRLLPLSQSEIESADLNWIDSLFAGKMPQHTMASINSGLIDRVLLGGYPEPLTRQTPKRRATWARQYIESIISRDVKDISTIKKLDKMPALLELLAQSAGQLCNYTDLGSKLGIDSKTAEHYISVFEQIYLLERISPWASNRGKRLTKQKKLQFIDSGILSSVLNLNERKVDENRTRLGNVLETFVFSELQKHINTSDEAYKLMFYRDNNGAEVDFVIQNSRQTLIGVEVKASATIQLKDLNGLKKLKSIAAEDFKLGILLYGGDKKIPFGEDLWALPISSLWGSTEDIK